MKPVEQQNSMSVLIADDQTLFGSAVSFMLSQLEPDLEVQTTDSVAGVLEIIDTGAEIDLILLDYDMPNVDGVTGMNLILDRSPGQRIAIISGMAPPQVVKMSIDKGATGWLTKNLNATQIHYAIRMMAAGAVYVPAEVLDAIEETEERWGKLTQAEHGVVRLVADGLADKEVAIILDITPKTVQMHMRKILKKIGVDNRTRLALAYLRDN